MVAIVTRTGTTTTPQPPRSRRNTGRSPPTTPSLSAPAIVPQPSLGAPFPSALTSPAFAPQPSLVAPSPGALPSPASNATRVRFSSTIPPSPAQPPASASPQSTSDFPHDTGAQLPPLSLRTHSLHRDSNSFFTSVGMALAHRNADDAPFCVNIRESVVQFISDNASDNFALSNFAERALCFQQAVTNRYTEHLDLLMQRSIDNAAAPLDDLLCGMQVLLPWPGDEPPTALHPRYRGPFRIVHKRRNVLHLEHIHWPLPVDQPANLSWSTHAFVYSCDLPFLRSPDDPSAAQMSLSSPTLAIDCVIQHRPHPAASSRSSTVEDFQYLVRFHGTSAVAHLDQGAWKDYIDIRHSMAFDSYAIAHPFLTGHTPISFMPANWDPYLPPPSLRPAHEALPLSERHIPLHEAI